MYTRSRTLRCLRFWRLEINPPSLKPGIHLMVSHLSTSPATFKKPADYRDLYQTLGTYFVLDPKGGNQMHLTYASPGAADYYRRNKKFADGTVLGEGSLRS